MPLAIHENPSFFRLLAGVDAADSPPSGADPRKHRSGCSIVLLTRGRARPALSHESLPQIANFSRRLNRDKLARPRELSPGAPRSSGSCVSERRGHPATPPPLPDGRTTIPRFCARDESEKTIPRRGSRWTTNSLQGAVNADERVASPDCARALHLPQEVSSVPKAVRSPANDVSPRERLEHAFAGMCSRRANPQRHRATRFFPAKRLKPTPGLEPGTPSLRVMDRCPLQSSLVTSGRFPYEIGQPRADWR